MSGWIDFWGALLWIDFWGALLVATLVLYALMVLYVSIGGFKDIRRMFRTLSAEAENKPAPDDDEQDH